MFGVVIWSDPGASSAVIWCEEKRSLAYLDARKYQNVPPPGFFDAGDYVEFDLVDEDRRWMAFNTRAIDIPAAMPRPVRPMSAPVGDRPRTTRGPGAEIIQISDHLKSPSPGPTDVLNHRG